MVAKHHAAFVLVYCAAFIHAQGTITTIAGGGQVQFAVGGPATNVPLANIGGITTDSQGNVYVADSNHHVVEKIATTGVLTIVAGNGAAGSSGDGGPATNASFEWPGALTAERAGNLFIGNRCAVRTISGDGTHSTYTP